VEPLAIAQAASVGAAGRAASVLGDAAG